ncbi:glycosyltransferase 87 family protein [Streptomyces phaeoluteigriseus]|uniref:glycosyltransferase 87 family protein n=1 Tax=Streptomyces phaeoluteigriseus TaxID=114686 RepID=UPI0036BF4F21
MSTGKDDISGWLVRRSPWPPWLGLVAVLGVLTGHVARATPDGGMDNAIVVRAAHAWLEGRSPYDDPHFLYLPGAVLAAVPQALLPPDLLRVLVPSAVMACLVGGWACALRLHRVPLDSRLAALGLIALAAGFAPFGHLVRLGNWTATAVLGLPLGLLLMRRGRWTAAGAVLGTALALKPLLAPLALLFLFAGRWKALAVLAAVPALASGACALLLPDPAGFFTRTLPFLLHGQDAFVRLYEASPGAVLPRLGVPRLAARTLALAACAAGLFAAYRRWGRADPGPLRLSETAAGLMLSVFLVSRPSYDHYLVVVVPLLLAGLSYPGSVARGPWFWLALVPQLPGLTWPYLEQVQRRAFKDAVTLCGLMAAVAAHRPDRRPRVGPAAPAGEGPRAAAPGDDHIYTG